MLPDTQFLWVWVRRGERPPICFRRREIEIVSMGRGFILWRWFSRAFTSWLKDSVSFLYELEGVTSTIITEASPDVGSSQRLFTSWGRSLPESTFHDLDFILEKGLGFGWATLWISETVHRLDFVCNNNTMMRLFNICTFSVTLEWSHLKFFSILVRFFRTLWRLISYNERGW